jgi:hypothetical protein
MNFDEKYFKNNDKRRIRNFCRLNKNEFYMLYT